MFLFEPLAWHQVVMWFVVLGGLILINELARINKWFSLAVFLALPLVLTVAVWPTTAGEGTSMNDWFHRAKVYSALAGCLGFLALRHVKGASRNKWVLMFPPLILAINIMEACIRDFQIYSLDLNGVFQGMMTVSGPWNLMNGIAGLLNIITISGWMGIFVSNDKHKDMLWPDMLWFWIIAYDLWNFAYVYNCLSDHAFYAGAALLISCTIPAFLMRTGAWLQHRAQTLAIWCMFAMTYPAFIDTSKFAVQSSHNTTALWLVSGLALASNVAVFVYHVWRVAKFKRNPFKQEIYPELEAYRKVAAEKA